MTCFDCGYNFASPTSTKDFECPKCGVSIHLIVEKPVSLEKFESQVKPGEEPDPSTYGVIQLECKDGKTRYLAEFLVRNNGFGWQDWGFASVENRLWAMATARVNRHYYTQGGAIPL